MKPEENNAKAEDSKSKKPNAETKEAQNSLSSKTKNSQKNKKIAIVRIRGSVRVKEEILNTLNRLKLFKVNYCVVYDETPSVMGMIKKAKDYITWGEIDDETLKMLNVARAKPDKSKNAKSETKSFFRLNPPVKGYGRKGIKKAFSLGGALGYRGEKINDLIKRML